jgi:crossover junction endodeoxyribonuclease RuvC
VRVLGLDPGSRRTGFGVVDGEGNRYHALKSGHVSASAKLDLAHRLHAIIEKVGAILDELSPDAVAVEEAFYHESVRSTLVLGHVRGALLVAAVSRGIPVAEYTPREIKMSVTGHGGATKEQVAFMVQRVLALRGTLSLDAADALAAALCHHHRSRLKVPKRAVTAAARTLEQLLARRSAR